MTALTLSTNLDDFHRLMCTPKDSASHKQPFTNEETPSVSHNSVPSIKLRQTQQPCPPLKRGHHRGGRFWDTLSTIHLTRGALKEFDLRIHKLQQQSLLHDGHELTKLHSLRATSIKRFARHGGLDLTHLRGFASRATPTASMPPVRHPPATRKRQRMSHRSLTSSLSHKTKSSMPDSMPLTSESGATGRSSPYSENFTQKLIDKQVYPKHHVFGGNKLGPKPSNIDDIRQRLKDPRASLSPSQFTDEHFEDFVIKNNRASGEGTTTVYNIGPIVGGSTDKKYNSEMNKPFQNLHLLDEDISAPQPDLYDGMAPEFIPIEVREKLHKFIVPSTDTGLPAAPNFFAEWMGAEGQPNVLVMQACHDGTAGARGMHKLHKYGRTEADEVYDNKANTFSSTYHPMSGTLMFCSHHMTAPETPGGNPCYHMTQISAYAMKNSAADFRKGAAAYRNLRDLAAESRVDAVKQAKSLAEQQSMGVDSSALRTSPSFKSTMPDHSSESSMEEPAVEADMPKGPRTRASRPQSTSGTQRQPQQPMLPATNNCNQPQTPRQKPRQGTTRNLPNCWSS